MGHVDGIRNLELIGNKTTPKLEKDARDLLSRASHTLEEAHTKMVVSKENHDAATILDDRRDEFKPHIMPRATPARHSLIEPVRCYFKLWVKAIVMGGLYGSTQIESYGKSDLVPTSIMPAGKVRRYVYIKGDLDQDGVMNRTRRALRAYSKPHYRASIFVTT